MRSDIVRLLSSPLRGQTCRIYISQVDIKVIGYQCYLTNLSNLEE